MIERAGVDEQALNAGTPGECHQLGEQPFAVAHSGEFRHQAQEPDQAFAGAAEVEFDEADLDAAAVHHRMNFPDIRRERRIVHL
jgi:hypothetical protein